MTTLRLLTDRELADLFGCSRASIWRWLKAGKLPAPITVGDRSKRWRQSDVERFIEGKAA